MYTISTRDAGRHVEMFLDVKIEGKHTPVTVQLSYEQASDLAILLEPFRKPPLGHAAARRSEGDDRRQPVANSTGSISVPSSASAFELLTRFDAGREGAALVLSQSLCDALLDCFVLSPQRHLIILRVLLDLRTARRGRLL
jgi:hypothetical protein